MSGTFVVSTSYGPVRGNKRVSCVGDTFFSFRGIPYAKPPLRALRFKDPQVPEPWILPRDVTQPGNIAMCSEFMDFHSDNVQIPDKSSEDCLLLNVYTKELQPANPLPVMVYIHGGGFKTGSGDETLIGFDYFLRHNVLCVSINYRLGALGFMSFNDPNVGVPGNAGLKDQTLALKWVRDNIERFGGDPGNVTIFGNSAGGGSVHHHMHSEMSRGLFHRAIAQSGTMNTPWAVMEDKKWGERLAKRLGWTGEGGPRGAYDFLKEADATAIVHHQDVLADAQERLDRILTFVPVSEPYESEQTFFTGSVEDAMRQAWGHSIPLLIGGSVDEGLLFGHRLIAEAEFLSSAAGVEVHVPASVRQAKGPAVLQQVRDFYGANDEAVPPISADNFMPLSHLWGDSHFWLPIRTSIEARLHNGATGPTYLFRFAMDSRKLCHIKVMLVGKDMPGTVCHADELLYMFKGNDFETLAAGSTEAAICATITDIWTHFAATGDPTTAESTKMLGWKQLRAEDSPNYQCLDVNDELTVRVLPETDRHLFWEELLKM